MLRQLLKSKIHRASVSMADPEYEGSIEIPQDLMDLVDLWPGEKVLVTSATAGGRLETYVQPGPVGSKRIVMNGGAAHLIKKGERVTIMAFCNSETAVESKRIVCNEDNEVIRKSF